MRISDWSSDVCSSDLGERFVPNDVALSPDDRLWLVTGPNMGGKSTFLRQNALIVVLAQAGAFVPAASAKLGLVDRLFSRVGARSEERRVGKECVSTCRSRWSPSP